MTAPFIPPQTWIKRIQNAMSVSRSDPRWQDAQGAIEEMKQHLRDAVEVQRGYDKSQGEQEMQQALSMSPGATFAEGIAKGASFGLGDIAASLTGSGDVLEASAAQHPLENLAGDVLGTAGTMFGPGLLLKGLRAARMAEATEEGLRLSNALKSLRLARMGETAQTGRGAAQAAEEATQSGGRLMSDAERAASNEARMAGRASGDPLDEATYARRGPPESAATTGEAAQTASSATPAQPMDILPSSQPPKLLGPGPTNVGPMSALFALLGNQLGSSKRNPNVQ